MEIRKAEKRDLNELISLLSELTVVGKPDQINDEVFENIFLAIIGDKIIACSTILIENKIIHEGSKVGHIEDVVVTKEHRGKGIGQSLIDYCVKIAKEKGCYKVILDCNSENAEFYQKCGFKVAGVCMRLDIN